MKTTIVVEFPLKRTCAPSIRVTQSFFRRAFQSILQWGGGSIHEFCGSRVNTVRHLGLFGWHLITIHRDEYPGRSDAERAEYYLRRWATCERQLQALAAPLIHHGSEN